MRCASRVVNSLGKVSMSKSKIDVVLGLQRGDEGKGRLSDKLAATHDIVARYNGGPNAGHTIYVDDKTIALHQVPAGALYPNVLNIIGNGMYIDPLKLVDEIKDLKSKGLNLTPKNLAVSYAAHLILPHHILLDELREGGVEAQGSTKAGIAYVAGDKYERSGVRAELLVINPKLLGARIIAGLDSVNEKGRKIQGFKPIASDKTARAWLVRAVELKPYITDTALLLNQKLKAGKSVLAEGAQAAWLDIDGGMYPFVTSSHPTIGGALNGLRVGHKYVDKVYGVMKAAPSHVGDGPFVTEIKDENLAAKIRGQRGEVDAEFGATTGRPRRVGWIDLPAIRTSIRDNGVTDVVLTKLDSLQKFNDLSTIPVAVAYKYEARVLREAPSSAYMLEKCHPLYKNLPLWQADISQAHSWKKLPREAKAFVEFLEKELDTPISMVGVGPGRDQLISRS